MPINGTPTSYDLARAANAIRYIEEKYRDRITAEQLAEKDDVRMNVKLLRKMIYSITGMSIHQYLTKVRVERVKEQLVDCSRPIKAIALCNGFSCLTQLGRQFKKETGMSPQKYRYHLVLQNRAGESSSLSITQCKCDEDLRL